MVEFGLKLQDNQVAEWADKYVDYLKLKDLISKAATASEKRQELEKRMPTEAAKIKAEYFASLADGDESSIGSSTANIKQEQLIEHSSSQVSLSPAFTDEKQGLLQGSKSDHDKFTTDNVNESKADGGIYGSNKIVDTSFITEEGNARSGMKRSMSTTELMQTVVSGVGSLFKADTYKEKLRRALKNELRAKRHFKNLLEDEVQKVVYFYNLKLTEVEQLFSTLMESVPQQLQAQISLNRSTSVLLAESIRGIGKNLSSMKKRIVEHPDDKRTEDDDENEREMESIKRALTDLHRTAKLLINFSILNYTGCVKIVKKYEKKVPDVEKGYFKENVIYRVSSDGIRAQKVADSMERKFAKWFCSGNINEARVKMLPKKGDKLEMDWSQLRLGYRLGMCSILLVWVAWDCIYGLIADGKSTIGARMAFPVFRGCGGLLVFHWFWGFSTAVWSRFRVNYIFLFDFDPRTVDTSLSIFNDCVDETLVFLILMLLYYKAGAHDIPKIAPDGVYPFLLVLYTVRRLLFPLRTRKPLWEAIFGVISSPMTSPSFFMVYVADVFTSMVKVFIDLSWTLCFVLTGSFLSSESELAEIPFSWVHNFWYKDVAVPLICLAPLWFRFNQCLRKYFDTGTRLPHLANAFKYALSQTVTLFGAFHPLYMSYGNNEAQLFGIDIFQFLWVSLFVTSSLYSFFWDVFMDWGLGRPAYGFLGPRLMFPKPIYYYSVIFIDLFLRFMWVLSLIPPQSGASFAIPNYLTAVTMILELLRRTLWSFFRLENEHRSNTSQYRRVDYVPLHFNTGHNHSYKNKKSERGWAVLAEVLAVSFVVIVISGISVISARRSTRYDDSL